MKKLSVSWQKDTRLDYFLTAANILGYPNAPLAWGLSNVRWKSKQDLLQVAEALVTPPNTRNKGAA